MDKAAFAVLLLLVQRLSGTQLKEAQNTSHRRQTQGRRANGTVRAGVPVKRLIVVVRTDESGAGEGERRMTAWHAAVGETEFAVTIRAVTHEGSLPGN